MRKLLLPATALLLAGCQTWGPYWSELTGQRWNLTNLNTAPAVVQNVNGNGAFPDAPGQPIKVASGPSRIVLSAVPLNPRWTGGTELKVVEMNLEPCKRYYLNARWENPLSMSDWTPFVDYVETIAGCTPPAPPAPPASPAPSTPAPK